MISASRRLRGRVSRGVLSDLFGGMRQLKDSAMPPSSASSSARPSVRGTNTAMAVMGTVMESLNFSNEEPHLFRKEKRGSSVSSSSSPSLSSSRHVRERFDEYAYLSDVGSPEVRALLEAENEYLERVLVQAGPVRERLEAEYEATAAATARAETAEVDREGGYVYYERVDDGAPFPVLCRRRDRGSSSRGGERGEEEEEVVLDMNEIAREREIDYVSVPQMRVSPDNERVAYVLDAVGDDSFAAHVRDIRTGRESEADRVEGAFAVEWSAGGGHLLYTLPDRLGRPSRVYAHRVGRPQSEDRLLYEEADPAYVVDVSLTKDRRLAVVSSSSKTTSEARVTPASDEALAAFAPGRLALVEPRSEGVEYYVEHHGGSLYSVTNGGTEGAVGSRLVRRPLDAPPGSGWDEVVPDREGVAIEDVDVFERHLVLYERGEGGAPAVRVLRFGGAAAAEAVPLPPGAATGAVDAGAHSSHRAAAIRLHVTSPSLPPHAYVYDLDSGELRTADGRPPPAPVPPDAVTERVSATSHDGVAVPLTLYRKGSMPRNNRNPTLLLGYGAYGTPLEPRFDPAWVSLVRRGWVVAYAHVRGGGELGRRWYEGGREARKENSFRDFVACAESLVDGGVTQPALMAAHGQSAGGLLLAAVANERPDLFKAMVLRVPFVDVLGSMLDESHALTSHEYREWGDPRRSPDAYERIARYSPYDNVGTHAYPSMLVTAAALDARVDPSQPVKYVARLRDRMTNLDDAAVLLQTDLEGGHYGDSGRSGRAAQRALEIAFVANAMGVPVM